MRRSFVTFLGMMLIVSPHTVLAQFDDSAGREGEGQYQEYKEEMEPRAERASEKVKPDSVTHHPYFDGVGSPEEVKDNNDFDLEVIRNEATYDKCMQYEPIGLCQPVPGDPEPNFFVRYWGPFMKGEEVPEAFRTGYMTKEDIKPIKEKALEDYYDDFMNMVIPAEYKFGTETAVNYLNSVLDIELTPPPEMTPRQDVIDATKEAIKTYGDSLGEASMAQDGYVFNEYHLMKGDTNNYGVMKPPKIFPWGPGQLFFWCHMMKEPVGSWYSEFPENRLFSRVSDASNFYFGNQMNALRYNPLTCLNFNKSQGRTPAELAAIDRLGGGSSAPCQGINHGLWVPVTNQMHTMYQTTAAALGLTKSKIAHEVNPSQFYRIDPAEDRVQWIRNKRMDGINSGKAHPDDAGQENVIDEKTKRCDVLAKWVLDYKKGNLKISPDEEKDFWYVLAHWRKIRCCVKGGGPEILFPQFAGKESLSLILY